HVETEYRNQGQKYDRPVKPQNQRRGRDHGHHPEINFAPPAMLLPALDHGQNRRRNEKGKKTTRYMNNPETCYPHWIFHFHTFSFLRFFCFRSFLRLESRCRLLSHLFIMALERRRP